MPAWSLDEFKIPPYRRERVRARELMDDPTLDSADRAEALEGIETISRWWGQRWPLLRSIIELLGKPSRKFRLIEVGAGNGHLGRWIAVELGKRGFDVEVVSTDLSPVVGVKVLDATRGPLPEADLYFSSLLLHHLSDWQVCQMMLLQSQAAKIGFVHFDLRRHWLHYQAARLRIALAGLPPINQRDACLSIQQAFTRPEIDTFATATGLAIKTKSSFPFRWLLTWAR